MSLGQCLKTMYERVKAQSIYVNLVKVLPGLLAGLYSWEGAPAFP